MTRNRTLLSLTVAAGLLAGCVDPEVRAALKFLGIDLDPTWGGELIPAGQQCRRDGGQGDTPELWVSGLPPEATDVRVAYNDRSVPHLASGGSYGIIGYDVTGHDGTAALASVPGESSAMPDGARIVRNSRTGGALNGIPGYMPPCSGGRGHDYFAVVTAYDGQGAPVARGQVELGKY